MLLYLTLFICFFFIELVPKSNISVFRPVFFQVRAWSPDRGPMVGEDILTKITKNCMKIAKTVPFWAKKLGEQASLWRGWWWWWIVAWWTDERRLALLPAGTIVRDPHHRESPTRSEQDKLIFEWWGDLLSPLTRGNPIRTIFET